MSLATHCDARGCDTWARGTMTRGFITLDWDDLVLHFCGWDCVLRYGATREPSVTMDL